MKLWKLGGTRLLGLSDLVPWLGIVDPGVVVMRDGALLLVWEYQGLNLEGATVSEVRRYVEGLRRAFALLDERWMIQVHALRNEASPYPAVSTTVPVLQMTEGARRARRGRKGATYTSRYFLSLTWDPAKAGAGTRRVFVREKARQLGIEGQVEELRSRVQDFESTLLSVLPGARRLGDDRILGFLHRCVTGIDQELRPPDPPVYINAAIGGQDFVAGMAPKVGEDHIAVVSIDGYPGQTSPGVLETLNSLGVSYHWSTRWRMLSGLQATQALRLMEREWRRSGTTMGDLVKKAKGDASGAPGNPAAAEYEKDTARAREALMVDEERFGYLTSVVVLMDPDPEALRASVQQVLLELRGREFGARFEDMNAVEAYRGSWPGEAHSNVRRPMVRSANFVHMAPWFSTWPGESVCPSNFFPAKSPPLLLASSRGSTPFFLNLHKDDLGHTLVLGPTGSGKSVLLCAIASAWRARYEHLHARVISFDKGRSMYALTRAVGGSHYEPAAEEAGLGLQVLAHLDVPGEAQWLVSFLEDLVSLARHGEGLTPEERSDLHRGIELVAANEREPRRLSTVYNKLTEGTLRQTLEPYVATRGGTYKDFLDSDTEEVAVADWTVFEMATLMEYGEALVVPVLLYLFRRIERQLDGRPTLLLLDEAWTFLLHPRFRDQIKEWLKEMRKKNAAVVLATQSLADLEAVENPTWLFEAMPTRIFLPNDEAETPMARALYEALGLNARLVGAIANATAKKDYIVVKPSGRRICDLDLTPEELAFVGVSDKQKVARVRALESQLGDAWPAAWLRECGLVEAADRLDRRMVA